MIGASMVKWPVIGLLVLLARLSAAQYGYNYDLNYYDDYSLYTAGYHYDMYDEDEEGLYFNPYTNTYDDAYGDEFFGDIEEDAATCRLDEKGKPKFNGTVPCNLKLGGADGLITGLKGGIDGVYKVWSCEGGRPLYKREGSPKNEERVLWYSSEFRDWDLANGTSPTEEDILVYGGTGSREQQPEYVAGQWSIATEFLKDKPSQGEYTEFGLTVTCEDGSKPDPQEHFKKPGSSSLLTNSEIEDRYRAILQKGAAKDSSAEVNLGLVSLCVMIGLGVVFGLPYMVARTRKGRKASAANSGALSSILDLSRKRGHTN